jgi:glycerol-3-phosphate dehydrogenase (NAD(P)+)
LKIAVLGAGAWGTALAMQISQKHQVTLWARNAGHVSGMRKARSNPLYLGDFPFNDQLMLEDNLEEAIRDAELILSVVPTSGFRAILKGLEAGTAKLPHEVAIEELGDPKKTGQHWGALSGPSFAAELVRSLPTALTLAATDEAFTQSLASIIHGNNLRVYTSQDVIGVSVGGALKNVIAIAAGISDGMGFGNNARAALITRGLAEITRFGMSLGGQKDTFMGLTGAGDLILTCTGDYSRNREVGLRLAKGQTINEVLKGLGHVAEGVYTAKEVVNRAKALHVSMPIMHEVNQVLSFSKSPKEAVIDLLGREQKSETH